LEVSLNAQDYSNSSVTVPFVFSEPLDLDALVARLLAAGRRLAQGETEQGAAGRVLADAAETEEFEAGVVPISPLSGPMLGDTLLTLYLPNFNLGTGYQCKFDERAAPLSPIIVPATYNDASTRLKCFTPALPRTGRIDVSITLNAQNFQLHPLNVTSFAPVAVHTLSPTSGPQRGNTTVLVTGASFVSVIGTDIRCKFGGRTASVISPAMVLNSTALLCTTPPRDALLPQTLLPPRLGLGLGLRLGLTLTLTRTRTRTRTRTLTLP
jgi:hypothetical protein